MKLRDLDATFVRIIEPQKSYEHIDALPADGVLFQCPTCFRANGGPVGTHYVMCWQPHVPQTEPPTPGRWSFQGSSLENLTLVAGSSSVFITEGCKAHFFVRNGEIVFA